MKRIFAVLFAISITLSLIGCSLSRTPTEASNPSYTDYVSEASFVEMDNISLPYIDEGKLTSETISEINADIRSIYKKLTEAPPPDNASNSTENKAADIPKASYSVALNGNVLSIFIEYHRGGTGESNFEYAAYNIDVTSAESISVDQIFSLAGLSLEQVRNAVKIERDAALVYLNNIYSFADKENAMTLEDYMEEAVSLFDKDYDNGSLPVYLGNNGLTVFSRTHIPAPSDEYRITGIDVSSDARKIALDNAASEVMLAVINDPTDAEKIAAAPSDKFMLKGTSMDMAEPLLLTALHDNTHITLEYVNYDYDTGEFSVTQTAYENTLARGESIYVEAIRPEVRAAEMRLVVDLDGREAIYYFQFNGRFGNLKIEYVG